MLPNTRGRRGFGRLRRRASGRWQAAYVGPDDCLHSAPTTFDAKDDAIAWLSAERKLCESDTWTPPADRVAHQNVKSQTFGEFAETWLETRRTRRGPLKPRTKADYRRLLDRHLLPAFKDRTMRSIRTVDVNAWYVALNPHTPTERAHAYQLLRAIFTSAVDPKVRLLVENPCQVAGGGQVTRAHEIRTASPEELAIIIERMPDNLRLAVMLGAWCALRYGEIAELRRGDIDLKNGRLRVQRGVTWPDGQPTVGTPKTDAGRRTVYVPPHLLPALEEHLKKHVSRSKDSLLISAAQGGHLHPRTFGKRFDTAREAAERPDLHFHDLRHTGAVLAAQTGATLAELMARLGHSTPGAAMRYQHAAADRDKAIAEALSKLAERT